MRRALDLTLVQVTNRRQFNRIIGEFGMVREKLAGMRTHLHVLESAMRLVTGLEDEQPDSILWESLVLKLACTEWAWLAADDAVQLHGGSGFIEDTGVARLLRDVRITRIFEGANEVLRFHLASAAFTWDTARLAENPPLGDRLDPALEAEGQRYDALLRRFASALAEQKKAHGLKVFGRQMAQRRIADAAAALYLTLGLLVRAHGEIRGGRASDELRLWTKHASWELAAQVERSLHELSDNADELSSRIASAECARVGTPLQEKNA
jgi:hypothetical protein